jgi:hypothetical protein
MTGITIAIAGTTGLLNKKSAKNVITGQRQNRNFLALVS